MHRIMVPKYIGRDMVSLVSNHRLGPLYSYQYIHYIFNFNSLINSETLLPKNRLLYTKCDIHKDAWLTPWCNVTCVVHALHLYTEAV